MTQFSLKLLALFCMLCDHFAKVILARGVLVPALGWEMDLLLQTILLVLGRISFPIFAWFTAEGCQKTKNPKKYLLRLLAFAVISEIPFQLCFYGGSLANLQLGCHNVIFTMFLGALGIFLGQRLQEKSLPKWFALGMPALLVIWWGYYFQTDYNAWGVGLIVLLYYFKDQRQKLLFLTCWATVFMLIWHGWNGETLVWLSGTNNYMLLLEWIGCLFAVGFLLCYNGERGKGCKWLFYVFYPLHLFLLYLLRCIVG